MKIEDFVQGPRCCLCGGGSDGFPSMEVLSAGNSSKMAGPFSNEDGLLDRYGILGPLLGPLNENSGVSGFWIHRKCAIWSPEVYFSVVGLKNVYCAIRRGMGLKCSRCNNPGATLGCRLKHCIHTYHFPCAWLENCSFDQDNFLAACPEHRSLYETKNVHAHSAMDKEKDAINSNLQADMDKKQSFFESHRSKEGKQIRFNEVDDEMEWQWREKCRLEKDLSRITPFTFDDLNLSLNSNQKMINSSPSNPPSIPLRSSEIQNSNSFEVGGIPDQNSKPELEVRSESNDKPQPNQTNVIHKDDLKSNHTFDSQTSIVHVNQNLFNSDDVHDSNIFNNSNSNSNNVNNDNNKSNNGWNMVAGLDNVIQCLKEMVIFPLIYPSVFEKLQICPPRGVLLHGCPGTGKTLAVKCLAKVCFDSHIPITFFSRKGADCLGKYVGDAERQLRLLFQVAEEKQPSVIYFDEIDGLAPARSARQDQTQSSVVSTLLSLMDGLQDRGKVIVIASTNQAEAIDPALRRPGRFDREIAFPLPSFSQRKAILRVHAASFDPPPPSSFLAAIAESTAGFSGADLHHLCTETVMTALRRVCSVQSLIKQVYNLNANGSMDGEEEKDMSEGMGRDKDDGFIPLPCIQIQPRDWKSALKKITASSKRGSGLQFSDIPEAKPLPHFLFPALGLSLSFLLASLSPYSSFLFTPSIAKACHALSNLLLSPPSSSQTSSTGSVSFSSPFDNLVHRFETDGLFVHKMEYEFIKCGLIDFFDTFESKKHALNHMNSQNYSKYFPNQSPFPKIASTQDENMHDKIDIHGDVDVDADNGDDDIIEMNVEMKEESNFMKKQNGFCLLLCGEDIKEQNFLSQTIIYGLNKNISVQLLNLSTLLSEGYGNVVSGIISILESIYRNMSPLFIFIPNIESWACEVVVESNKKKSNIQKSSIEKSNIKKSNTYASQTANRNSSNSPSQNSNSNSNSNSTKQIQIPYENFRKRIKFEFLASKTNDQNQTLNKNKNKKRDQNQDQDQDQDQFNENKNKNKNKDQNQNQLNENEESENNTLITSVAWEIFVQYYLTHFSHSSVYFLATSSHSVNNLPKNLISFFHSSSSNNIHNINNDSDFNIHSILGQKKENMNYFSKTIANCMIFEAFFMKEIFFFDCIKRVSGTFEIFFSKKILNWMKNRHEFFCTSSRTFKNKKNKKIENNEKKKMKKTKEKERKEIENENNNEMFGKKRSVGGNIRMGNKDKKAKKKRKLNEIDNDFLSAPNNCLNKNCIDKNNNNKNDKSNSNNNYNDDDNNKKKKKNVEANAKLAIPSTTNSKSMVDSLSSSKSPPRPTHAFHHALFCFGMKLLTEPSLLYLRRFSVSLRQGPNLLSPFQTKKAAPDGSKLNAAGRETEGSEINFKNDHSSAKSFENVPDSVKNGERMKSISAANFEAREKVAMDAFHSPTPLPSSSFPSSPVPSRPLPSLLHGEECKEKEKEKGEDVGLNKKVTKTNEGGKEAKNEVGSFQDKDYGVLEDMKTDGDGDCKDVNKETNQKMSEKVKHQHHTNLNADMNMNMVNFSNIDESKMENNDKRNKSLPCSTDAQNINCKNDNSIRNRTEITESLMQREGGEGKGKEGEGEGGKGEGEGEGRKRLWGILAVGYSACMGRYSTASSFYGELMDACNSIITKCAEKEKREKRSLNSNSNSNYFHFCILSSQASALKDAAYFWMKHFQSLEHSCERNNELEKVVETKKLNESCPNSNSNSNLDANHGLNKNEEKDGMDWKEEKEDNDGEDGDGEDGDGDDDDRDKEEEEDDEEDDDDDDDDDACENGANVVNNKCILSYKIATTCQTHFKYEINKFILKFILNNEQNGKQIGEKQNHPNPFSLSVLVDHLNKIASLMKESFESFKQKVWEQNHESSNEMKMKMKKKRKKGNWKHGNENHGNENDGDDENNGLKRFCFESSICEYCKLERNVLVKNYAFACEEEEEGEGEEGGEESACRSNEKESVYLCIHPFVAMWEKSLNGGK